MYDIIVVGAGHAGIEACLAGARTGNKTLLITSNFSNAGSMPCNTSIGGPAKGIIVREIDALGGQMGKTTDATYLQMKMLNTAKGPGVQSLRAQADKKAYPRYMQKVLKEQENLDIVEAMVEDLIVEGDECKGVILADGTRFESHTTILTTGTYLKAEVLVGHSKTPSGPDKQKESLYLSSKLKDYGFRIQRLKTGTPPRVEINSIDYSKTTVQPGTDAKLSFSYETTHFTPVEDQTVCYLTYTTAETHKLIRDNLDKCAMFSGLIKGIGPRYCPSIEDKVVKFADKERHQIFLEPESKEMNTIYVQGFSTSMPHDIQEKMVHSLPGLENCTILKYAYAIEYDAIDPLQMKPSLENKIVENLFTAGQVNGTSGYEEAAGQGIMAGINACLKIDGKDPFILRRDEAYIGVMIDDLVTKGTKEPYRLLTSRAEYRLLLRHDNADQRLLEKAYHLGLVSKERYDAFVLKMEQIERAKEELAQVHIKPGSSVDEYLQYLGFDPLAHGCSELDLLKRPKVTIHGLSSITNVDYPPVIAQQVEIQVKYQGYIEKAKRDAKHLEQMEKVALSENLDYLHMDNLSLEARQKLDQIRPATLGQASRISGINPSDIALLAMKMKK